MKAWAKSLEKPAVEFSETQLTLLSGKIPEGLRGSLYRNLSLCSDCWLSARKRR